MEIVWTGLGSLYLGNWQLPAFTYLWMLPIYGMAIFMEPVHEEIRGWPWYWRGLVWMLIIFTIEYTTGWLLKTLLGSCPWDYTGVSGYHLRGLIRLDYAPEWFVAGLLFERIHDLLGRLEI